MRSIKVKVYPSKSQLKKEDQLAWKIAEVASDKAPLNSDSVEMVINRIIDNSAVAMASLERSPVIAAREMALAHPKKKGATIFGIKSDHEVSNGIHIWQSFQPIENSSHKSHAK